MAVSAYTPLNLLKVCATGGQSNTNVTISFIQFQKITCALIGTHRLTQVLKNLTNWSMDILSYRTGKYNKNYERRSGRSFFQACARFLLYALLFVGFLVAGLRSPHVPRLALLIFRCSFLDSFSYGTNFSMINSFSKLSVVGQVGLEPTTALSTGFTVRGDTNYTVLTHMA